jgi:hypothetical protein
LVVFFDLVTFFGLGAFFAWLAFARLYDKELREEFPDAVEKVRRNLYTINDYFLISFMFWATGGILDYLYHLRIIGPLSGNWWYNPLYNDSFTYLIMGVLFLVGLVTLALPMTYIRAIGKGKNDLSKIDPPDFPHTLGVFICTSFGTFFGVLGMMNYPPLIGRIVYAVATLLTYCGASLALKHWRQNDSIGGLGFLLTFSPFFWLLILAFL